MGPPAELVVLGLLFGLPLVSLVGAVLLRAAAHWVEKIDVPFDDAFITIILAGLASSFVGFCCGFGVGSATGSQDSVNVVALLLLPVGFVIQAECIRVRVRVSFGRACIVSLAMAGIALAAAVAIAVLVAGILWIFS